MKMDGLQKRLLPDGDITPDVRARVGLLCGVVGVAANAVLFLGKLAAGLAMSSTSVMADAFNNLSDAGTSIVTLVGFRVSKKPPDAQHPFGHGRAEYIVSLIIAFVILLFGYEFIKSAVARILNPAPLAFSWLSVTVLAVAMLIKLLLYGFYKRCGRRIHSSALLAAAVDSRNDVLVTLVALGSALVSRFTGLQIDGWAGVLVSLVLLYAGWSIAKEAASPLLGTAGSRQTAADIQSILLAIPEIIGVHDLIVHDYGSGHSIASIHAELDDALNLPRAHAIIDRAEREIEKRLGVSLVIHVDPVDTRDPALANLKEIVLRALSENAYATAHDFRMETGKRFSFDLEPQHGYDAEKLAMLVTALQAACEQAQPGVKCIVRVEYGFIENEC